MPPRYSDGDEDGDQRPPVPYVLQYDRIRARFLAVLQALESVRRREDLYAGRVGGRIGHLHAADVANLFQPLAYLKRELERIDRAITDLAPACDACINILAADVNADVGDLERSISSLRVSSS